MLIIIEQQLENLSRNNKFEVKENRTSKTKKYIILKCIGDLNSRIETAENSINLKILQSILSSFFILFYFILFSIFKI